MMRNEVSMGEMIKGLTIQLVVTGVVRARIRLWLGLRLMKLGALVTGCSIDVAFEPR